MCVLCLCACVCTCVCLCVLCVSCILCMYMCMCTRICVLCVWMRTCLSLCVCVRVRVFLRASLYFTAMARGLSSPHRLGCHTGQEDEWSSVWASANTGRRLLPGPPSARPPGPVHGHRHFLSKVAAQGSFPSQAQQRRFSPEPEGSVARAAGEAPRGATHPEDTRNLRHDSGGGQ